MKKLRIGGLFIRGLAAGLAVLACVSVAKAHPFASGITNNAGTISFILNEAATSVTITLTNDNTAQGTTIAGLTTRGTQSFSLTQGPTTYSSYWITAQKNGSGTFAPTGPDAQVDLFNGPRAVAVNMNPKTHNFGRIYVVNASPGTASPIPPGETFATRSMGKGVFVLNADGSDAMGYGPTSHPAANWPAGETWGTSTTTGPFKVFVGPDDMVYVGDATSSSTGVTCGGTVWMMDPDLVTPYNLLGYIGGASSSTSVTAAGNAGPCLSRPWVTGSLSAGTLKLYNCQFNFTDGLGFNYVFQYNITDTLTSQLPWTSVPDANLPGLGPDGWAGLDLVFPDIYFGPVSGELYESLERGGGNGVNGWVFTADGLTQNWSSQVNSGPATDPLTLALSVAVSPDEKYVAYVVSSGNIITMSITNNGAGNYAPDLTTCVTNATGLGGTARGIAWDLADNIYFDTGGDCVMRSYTLGLTSTCITSNDNTTANGSFSFSTPGTIVTVASVPNQNAYKNENLSTGSGPAGPSPGIFTVTRTGGSTAASLTVTVSIAGTALGGTDYSLSPVTTTTVTIPAGMASTTVTVNPIHTGVPELTTTVIMNIVGGSGYGTQAPNNTATVYISDDNTPTMQIASSTLFNTMYEANQYDYSTYNLTRLGNTNAALFTVNIAYNSPSGTAAPARYNGPATVTVNPGDVTDVLTITPNNDNLLQGNQTIIATLASGSGYNVTATTALTHGTNTIIDDELPAGNVLFYDNFNNSGPTPNNNTGPNTVSNYNVFESQGNPAVSPNNYVVTPQFDYSMFGIPPAPNTHDGSTIGIFIQADNPLSGTAAGVNLYPVLSTFPGVTATSFSGAYRMTVDMFLIENGGTAIAGTTEYALFGINHSGNDTNWFDNSSLTAIPTTWSFDGLWYEVEADGASLGDYVLESSPEINPGVNNDPTGYGSHAASTLTGVFKYPPYTIGAIAGGAPANEWPTDGSGSFTGKTPSWAEVEVDQVGSNITMKINNTTIISYVNTNPHTSGYTSGNVMIGYDDGYDGNGCCGAAVIFDNLTVTQLILDITSIVPVGNNIDITFTWSLNDPASDFVLQTASVASGPYTDNAAAIVETSPGVYTTSIAMSGSQQYYKVRHK